MTATNFSTDELTQSEAIKLGRALAKLEDLAVYGKKIEIFRLFEGRLQDVKEPDNIRETTFEVKDSNNSIGTETTISHEVKTKGDTWLENNDSSQKIHNDKRNSKGIPTCKLEDDICGIEK